MEPRQICSDEDVVALQARNGLLQFDEIRRLAAKGWEEPASVPIDAAMVRHLHEFATIDIFDFAGQFRDGPVWIGGTSHVPPPAEDVAGEVDDMMRYVRSNWAATPIHLCAYILWRCNWIHPFPNGNGRTTRGLAYLIFLLRLGYEPGGNPTFIQMISDDKSPYYNALDHADDAWKQGVVDVSAMEQVVSEKLAQQLVSIIGDAGGVVPPTSSDPEPSA